MEKEKPKIVHTELKGNVASRFDMIKSALGIQRILSQPPESAATAL